MRQGGKPQPPPSEGNARAHYGGSNGGCRTGWPKQETAVTKPPRTSHRRRDKPLNSNLTGPARAALPFRWGLKDGTADARYLTKAGASDPRQVERCRSSHSLEASASPGSGDLRYTCEAMRLGHHQPTRASATGTFQRY